MSRHKVTFRLDDYTAARGATAVLSDLLDPAPDAATCFEDGSAFRVEAYFSERPVDGSVESLISEVLGLKTLPSFEILPVPDLNWVAISQAALPPVSAGRFIVHGRHDRNRIARGPWTIEIDAGEAFGTAHHATTQGCLNAIDRVSRRKQVKRVLDLGCGSAVLAIAAARVWPSARVDATDIDPVAVDVARSNVSLNGAAGRIRTEVVNGVPRGRYDFVAANILAGPLMTLAPKLREATAEAATIVLSGLLVGQAAAVTAAYVGQGFALRRNERIAGWSALTLVKRD